MCTKAFSVGPLGQWVAALVATFGVFVTSQVFSWPTAAFPKIIDGSAGFDLTDREKSWVASLPNLGAFLSPIPCSYIIDRIGRKTTLTCSIFFVITCWLVLAFTQNVTLILLARFVMGLWNGTEFVTVSTYIAEVVDTQMRASLITITGMMFYMGALYVSLISYASYQIMTLLCVLPPVLVFVGFLFIPESPYFYLKQGKRKEAEEALIRLRGKCDPTELDQIEEAVKIQLADQGTFKEIFSKTSNRKVIFLVECFKICSATSFTILLLPFSTQIIPDGWLTSQESYIVLCLAWVVSALITSGLMYQFKIRCLFFVSTIGSILMLSSAAVWYYIRDFTNINASTTDWLPLILIILAAFFETIGIMSIANILTGEVFRINIKTKASAFGCMTALIAEGINFLFFYDIKNHMGMYFHFVKSAFTAALCLIVGYFCMIETKDKTSEMIEDMLNPVPPSQTAEQRSQVIG